MRGRPPKERIESGGIVYRQCSRCEDWFPETEKYFYTNSGGYLRYECKVCTSVAREKHYKKNRKKKLEAKREYYYKYRESLLRRGREKRRASCQQYGKN